MTSIVCKQKKDQYFYTLPKCPKTLYGFCVQDVGKEPKNVRSCKNVHLTTNGKVTLKKQKCKDKNVRKKSLR